MRRQAAERVVKLFAIPSVLIVAAISAYWSYSHVYDLISSVGERDVIALIGPVSVDGLIVATSMVIIRARRSNTQVPKFAYIALATGILATLCANIRHGWDYGPVGVMVSVWPAVAFIGTFETLMLLLQPPRYKTTKLERIVQATALPPAEDKPEIVKSWEPVIEDPPADKPAPSEAVAADEILSEFEEPEWYGAGLKSVPAIPPMAGHRRWEEAVKLYSESKDTGAPLSKTGLAKVMGLKNRSLARAVVDYVDSNG